MQQKIIHLLSMENFSSLPLLPKKGEKVFLRGDLGAGKTTIARYLIGTLLWSDIPVKSPTYVYYNKYGDHIYHFDLYRLSSYADFVNIWWEEILDNHENICIIEWPEILCEYYNPDIDVEIMKTSADNIREVHITQL